MIISGIWATGKQTSRLLQTLANLGYLPFYISLAIMCVKMLNLYVNSGDQKSGPSKGHLCEMDVNGSQLAPLLEYFILPFLNYFPVCQKLSWANVYGSISGFSVQLCLCQYYSTPIITGIWKGFLLLSSIQFNLGRPFLSILLFFKRNYVGYYSSY